MKQNNQYLWVFAIVFLAFFTGCQQDYLQEGNTSQDIYQLMGETFERYERNLVTFEEFSAHLQGYEVFEYYAPKFENADPEAYISRISKNKILKLENDSITTYTLNVVTSDEDNNSFTNILFIEKDNMLRRYFLKYTPTESWKNAVLEGGVYSGFEGSITFVDDSGQGFSFLENYPINEYSSSFGGCLAVFYTENTPCCLNISCCPCTDGNGVNTLVIDIQCPGGGSSGDDPGDNPWNGLLPDNGGGSEGGGTGPGIIQQIPTEPNFDYMVIHNLNTLMQPPLTFQQEEWIMENEENYQFAVEALNALQNGGEVDFDAKIIYDETFTDTETECVHEKMKSNSSSLFSKLLNHFNSSTNKQLTFSMNNNIGSDWGITKGTPQNSNYYQVIINKNAIDINGSNLMKYVTLCHELIHAYMFSELETLNLITFNEYGQPYLNVNCPSNTQNLNNLTIADRFVALICAMNQNGTLTENWTHDIFIQNVFDIETYRHQLEIFILNEYEWENENASFSNEAISIFGLSNWKQEIARAVSWIGLEGTSEFGDYLNSYSFAPTQLLYINDIRNKILTANSNCP